MTPAALTDEELLRLYEDLFRQHPATAELAKRFRMAIEPSPRWPYE